MKLICIRCGEDFVPEGEGRNGHAPCCSSHGVDLCCKCYRVTHFVEVGPCH